MIGELFAIIAPVFFGAAVGYGWARMGQPYDTALITRLLVNVTTPCLVFSRISTLELPAGEFAAVAGAAGLALISFAVLGFLAVRLLSLNLPTSLPPIVFPNCGNMGLPLCLFAFGEKGLALGLGFFVVAAVSQFTLSPWMNSGRFSPGHLLRSPLIFATFAAVAVLYFDLSVPVWALNTTSLLGDVSIPMMLITLGVSLARLKVGNLRASIPVALLRFLIGVSVGLGLITFLSLDPVAAGVVIIMCSMPPAVFNYLFAQKYGERAEDVAGTVIIATAAAFLLLPIILTYAISLSQSG